MRLLSNSLLPRYHKPDEDIKSAVIDASTTADLISEPLHIITPLVYSETLSARTGHNVYLKLDAFQPAGSFKLRGIGRTCQAAYRVHGPETHIIAASGGNAGLAAAESAKRLGLKCTVVVPKRTERSVVERLRGLGAQVENTTAEVLDDADQLARAIAAVDPRGVYVHPFESLETALGHASIVPEIRDQLLAAGVPHGRPDVISCSVGGGGLLRGIIHGINTTMIEDPAFARPKPRLVACQDFGAHSFGASFNRWLHSSEDVGTVVALEAITSQATSLGAKSCSAAALSAAIEYAQPANADDHATRCAPYLSTVIVDDAISASACWQFDRDHELMVEMACGAALSPIYLPDRIMNTVLHDTGNGQGIKEKLNIVVVVCGGSKVDREMLGDYERQYGAADEGYRVMIDGEDV
ncbi:catabolic L-serine/threonine dehydratase [Naganishia albida]|nr:catabolic L-serine/threonine dehydratase [Naganishia albida]